MQKLCFITLIIKQELFELSKIIANQLSLDLTKFKTELT